MNEVLDRIVDVSTYNFAVYPFELCFEQRCVNTSLMLPGSNTALEFLLFFFFSFCVLHHSILYTLVSAIFLTELISYGSDCSLKFLVHMVP